LDKLCAYHAEQVAAVGQGDCTAHQAGGGPSSPDHGSIRSATEN
jgi:hypothetical protein